MYLRLSILPKILYGGLVFIIIFYPGWARFILQLTGVEAAGCDSWEVAGIDFVDMPYGIFTKKRNFSTTQDNSADYWYVHDNRVHGYFSESGMQFNGSYNRIENNEIYKVSDINNTPYGCQLLNLVGNNNIVRGNILSRKGSTAQCLGILLEWDLADANLIENNTLTDVGWEGKGGLVIAGGDNNIIRYNTIKTDTSNWLYIYPENDEGTWPCNEDIEAPSIVPANQPMANDYEYFYPHNCQSTNNQVYDNLYVEP